MRPFHATVLACCLSSLGFAALGCNRSQRSGRSPDAGTLVTVYVPPHVADRLAGRLQAVAARHQWALSIRTDSAAIAEADVAFVDRGGSLVSRVRAGSSAAAQARQMADAVLP